MNSSLGTSNIFSFSSRNPAAAASTSGSQESSTEIRPHRCPNCNKTYSYSYYLESHLKKCKLKKDSKAAAFCEHCGLQFGSRNTLIRHQVEKHGIRPEGGAGSDAGKLTCEYCDRLFDDGPALVRIWTKLHYIYEGNVHRCKLCLNSLNVHRRWWVRW